MSKPYRGLILSTVIFSSSVFSFSLAQSIDFPHVEGEVIVKYKEQTTKTMSIKKAEDFSISSTNLNEESLFLLKSKDRSTEDLLAQYESDPNVEYAEPNYLYTIFTNDTYYSNLRGLQSNTDKDIDRNDAIDLVGTGFLANLNSSNPGSTIAIIDNGVDNTHSDLQNNMWSSSSCKSESGINIGTCDFGYNFLLGQKGSGPVSHYHGTHVAGILGAQGRNNLGVVGVNPGVKIMGLKVGETENLTLSYIISAVNFARYNGVKIINASFGAPMYTTSLENAINSFVSSGGIFIAAAGNDGLDVNSSTVNYPCGYSSNGLICVTSTDSNDNIASFSNYDPIYVDVAAPGTSIYSSALSGGYEYHGGTSMSTPYVAGLVSLARSYSPTLTRDQLVSFLFDTVDVLPSLSGKIKTSGRINAYNLLSSLYVTGVSLETPYCVLENSSLNWYSEQADSFSGYEYYISLNSGFSSIILSGFTSNTGIFQNLAKGKYYLGVQYINENGFIGPMSIQEFYVGEVCSASISGFFISGNPDDGSFVDILPSKHFGIAFDSNVFSSGYTGYQKISQINIYYTTGSNLVLFSTGISPLDVSGNLVDTSGQNFGAYYSGNIPYLQTYENSGNTAFGTSLPNISGLSLVLGLVDQEGYEIHSEKYPVTFSQEFNLNPKSVTITGLTKVLTNSISLRYPDKLSYIIFGTGLNTSGATRSSQTNKTGFIGQMFGYKNTSIILSSGDGSKDISVIFYRTGYISATYTNSIVLDTINLGATVSYSHTGATNQDVVATISLNETGTITNNGGRTGYTFTGNGTFTFQFQDLIGNASEITAAVTGIEKDAPEIIGITNNSTYTTSVTLTNITDASGISGVILDGILMSGWTNIMISSIGTHALIAQDILGNSNSITFTIKQQSSGGGGGGGGGSSSETKKVTTGTISNTGTVVETGIDLEEDVEFNISSLSGDISHSPYGTDINKAYQYAYSKQITTKDSILEANITDSLIRSHMAKMMSNFAMNVLGKKPDTSKKCNFIDISTQSQEMKNYIMLSCQLGLMGVGTNIFNPTTEVTRAQFGTVLSRSIRGDKYNTSIGNYYDKHLSALKKENIMTKIENPLLKELRGRVMLMLMRVDEKY